MASKKHRQLIDISRAAVHVAASSNAVPALVSDLRLFGEVLNQTAAFRTLLTDPAVTFDQRFEMLGKALNPEFRPEAKNTIGLLMQRHLLGSYPAFLEAAEQAARELAHYYECRVISAVELSDESKKFLEQALSKRFGGTVRLSYELDPAVLGGLEVICGDWRYRSTVQSKLQQLSQHLVMSS